MQRKILMVICSGIVMALVALAFLSGKTASAPERASSVIEMSDNGFTPAEISVKKGDRVDFVNMSTTTSYWPASDLHPTHELYSAFDPKRPISPGETWSFVFGKEGNWRMHDHLHPDKRGRIIVQ